MMIISRILVRNDSAVSQIRKCIAKTLSTSGALFAEKKYVETTEKNGIASKYIAKPAYTDLLSGFVSNFALRSMYAGFAIKTQVYCEHRWHRICLEFLSEFDANLVTICYQIVYWTRTIRLSDPASRNSLSLEMLKTLIREIKKDEDSKDLRSIVLASEPGKVFSAGHNLKELTVTGDKSCHKDVFETCSELMRAISKSPVPVIAAIDGLAAAAGCQLVAACDIVICTERSSFSTPGANVGIFCSTPGIPLVRNIPRKNAFYMLFTGSPISGKEAYEFGLVSKVVANDKLDEEIRRITDAINMKSRSVVHFGKMFLYEQMNLDISTAYLRGTEIMINNLKMKDAQEGIRSFLEKKKPEWSHGYEKI